MCCMCSHKDTGTTTVRENLMAIAKDTASAMSPSQETGDNKINKYSKVISELMVWLSITHPNVWQKVALIKDGGKVISVP